MSTLGPGSEHPVKSEEPDALRDIKREIDGVLEKLSLIRVHMGDYVVVMRSNFDVTVTGEPYIATMLLMNLWSKHYISRIWNKTVMKGSARSQMEFMEACKTLFGQGSPCLGYPDSGKCSRLGEEEFVISQTPFPRRISKGCQQLMGNDIDPDIVSCTKCLMLGDTDEDNGFKGEHDTNLDAGERDGSSCDTFNNIEMSPEEREVLKVQETSSSEFQLTFDTRQKCVDDATSQKCQADETAITEDQDPVEKTVEETKEMRRLKLKERKRAQHLRYYQKNREKIRNKKRRAEPGKYSNIQNILSKYKFFHEGKKGYRCDACDKKYNDTTGLTTHLKVKHLWGDFRCMTCNKREEYIENIQQHIKDMAHSQDVLCPVNDCREKISLQEMRPHYEKCIIEWNIRRNRAKPTWGKVCEICGTKFKSPKEYDRHLAMKHPSNDELEKTKYYCEKCGKAYNNKYSLDNHIQYSHGAMITCKLCNFSVQRARGLSKHMLTHEEAKFKCSICGKMLKTNKSLVIHEREHAGIKPFSCQVCGKSFPSKPGLKQHKRLVHRLVHRPDVKPMKSELKKGITTFITE